MDKRKPPSCGNPFVRTDSLEETVWSDIVEFVRNPGEVLQRLETQMKALVEVFAGLLRILAPR